jgi:hypothetical protein
MSPITLIAGSIVASGRDRSTAHRLRDGVDEFAAPGRRVEDALGPAHRDVDVRSDLVPDPLTVFLPDTAMAELVEALVVDHVGDSLRGGGGFRRFRWDVCRRYGLRPDTLQVRIPARREQG